jgi:hypothetical protein
LITIAYHSLYQWFLQGALFYADSGVAFVSVASATAPIATGWGEKVATHGLNPRNDRAFSRRTAKIA